MPVGYGTGARRIGSNSSCGSEPRRFFRTHFQHAGQLWLMPVDAHLIFVGLSPLLDQANDNCYDTNDREEAEGGSCQQPGRSGEPALYNPCSKHAGQSPEHSHYGDRVRGRQPVEKNLQPSGPFETARNNKRKTVALGAASRGTGQPSKWSLIETIRARSQQSSPRTARCRLDLRPRSASPPGSSPVAAVVLPSKRCHRAVGERPTGLSAAGVTSDRRSHSRRSELRRVLLGVGRSGTPTDVSA